MKMETKSTKLSFAIQSSRPRASPVPGGDGEDKSKLFLTEFESPKTLDDSEQVNDVIPPIQNTWCPAKWTKKKVEVPLTEADDMIGSVAEPLPTAGNDEGGVVYGLNVREKRGKDDGERVGEEKLREDAKNLPDARMEDYVDRPGEGFGAALLAGYGWKKGQAIGRNAKGKEDVKVKQFPKRFGNAGLGFVSVKPGNVDGETDDPKDESDYYKCERDSR